MAQTILEQLQSWLVTALNGVTVADGYNQTLVATQTMEKFLDGTAINDLDVLVALSSEDDAVVKAKETFDVEDPITTWWQMFDCFVHVVGQGGTGLTQDQRIARIVADVHKRIGAELTAHKDTDRAYCDGLAEAIDLPPWDLGVSPSGVCTVVNVPVRIKYTVLTRDPYSQPSS